MGLHSVLELCQLNKIDKRQATNKFYAIPYTVPCLAELGHCVFHLFHFNNEFLHFFFDQYQCVIVIIIKSDDIHSIPK